MGGRDLSNLLAVERVEPEAECVDRDADVGDSDATQAAALAGFPSYERMRRVFVREVELSPTAYQRRFATTRSQA